MECAIERHDFSLQETSKMPRKLEIATLDTAARHYAGEWLRSDRKSPSGLVYVGGPSYVMQDFYNFTFKDEFLYLLDAIKGYMGGKALAEFERMAREKFAPRSDDVFATLLRQKLAIDPNGNHLEGVVGTTDLGSRIVGMRHRMVRTSRQELVLAENVYWPILAGEAEERAAGRVNKEYVVGSKVNPIPDPNRLVRLVSGGATNPNISAALAVKMADLVDDEFNIGSTAANIRGRTGAQPADPDAAETGTLLFTLVMSDPAFGAAADVTPGGRVTASAITDDTSADATNTLGWCRCAATGTGADDVVDGEAGVSGSDFNFNTVAITAGSTVSMTSFTITVPQGATAT
jgi:hypothetical protein